MWIAQVNKQIVNLIIFKIHLKCRFIVRNVSKKIAGALPIEK